jgi:lysophospholipase L1-like esterase
MKPGSDGRRLAWLLAYQVAAVAGLFCLVEAGVRARLALIPPATIDSGLKNPPYFNNPGVTTSPRAFGYHLTYTLNKVGLRGPETTMDKPPKTKRVLLVGDSVIYGAMAKEDETLSEQLSRLLNKSAAGKWEVLNGGVGGYDVWDYEAWLRLKGLAFQPDVVVVGLYRNDHIGRDEYVQTTARKSAPNRRLMAVVRDALFRSETVNALLYWLQRRQPAKNPPLSVEKPLKPADEAAIDGFFPRDPSSARAIKDYLKAYRYDPYLVKDTLPWLLDVEKWKKIEEPLRGIKKLCDDRKIKLLAVVFPVQFELYPGYRWPEPERTIRGLLKSLEIPAVEMRPAFAAGGADELYRARYDYAHPSGEAYRLTAEALLKKVR